MDKEASKVIVCTPEQGARNSGLGSSSRGEEPAPNGGAVWVPRVRVTVLSWLSELLGLVAALCLLAPPL